MFNGIYILFLIKSMFFQFCTFCTRFHSLSKDISLYELTNVCLFFSLLHKFVDIQEFYEISLLDDENATEQKLGEIIGVAQSLESSPTEAVQQESKVNF